MYRLQYAWEGHESSGTINRYLEGHGIWCVKFSPSGESIACVGEGILKVWDAAGRLESDLAACEEINFSEVDWSKDGNLLVSGAENRRLKIWNFNTGRCVKVLEHEIVYSVKFSPDDSLILSGSDKSMAKIWKTESGVCLRMLHLEGAVEAVDFNRDGTRFTLKTCRNCSMYDLRTLDVVQDFTSANVGILSAKFFPDSNYMLCLMRDGLLSLYDLRNRKVAGIYKGINKIGESFFNISFTTSGEFIVRGSSDNSIYIWKANTQDFVRVLGHSDAVQCVDCHPDNNRIVSGSSDNSIKIWKLS